VASKTRHSRLHCSVCQQSIWYWGQQYEDKILIKSSYLKRYTAKRLTDEFPEKSWTKRGVNKLFKKLRDTGTVNRRPGTGKPLSARTEENAKPLLQKFPQSAIDFVLPIVRWSHREHLCVPKENKVSGRLQELLKQKLSALHASSTVRVCQHLCTAPLETIQTQVLTNNLGQRRPMISHGQSCGSAACILDLGLNH